MPADPPSSRLRLLPCLDSEEMAEFCRRELDIDRGLAVRLGRSAVQAVERGYYINSSGQKVDLSQQVANARAGTKSLPPDFELPTSRRESHAETRVQVTNETTLRAADRLHRAGLRPAALNFANGVNPGGGFLNGARAQEETLCRCSALYHMLAGDPMYAYHLQRPEPDSSDWVIFSPDVPVFRWDSGAELDEPWLLTILTSAAPYAPKIGQPMSADLLKSRISRVLAVASAFGCESLVLGAWGCGAFGNDSERTAHDFCASLQEEFAGHFKEVVFAISDWSSERQFLGPFREEFLRSGL